MTSIAQPTDRYLDLPGVFLRYVEAGHGVPVILVHGYMVDLEYQWLQSGVFARLARNFRVIAYDNRGHGKSQKFYQQGEYGLELARDLFRLMDGLGLAQAHVAGYSMGAMIVARSLIMRRGRFLSAALCGGAGRFAWTDADRMRNDADARDLRRGSISAHIQRLWPKDKRPPTAAELARLNAEGLAGKDLDALACVRVSMEELATPLEALAASDEFMLGLVGTADPFHGDLEQLLRAKPSFRLVGIPGASHADAPSRPAFHDALEAFFMEQVDQSVAPRPA